MAQMPREAVSLEREGKQSMHYPQNLALQKVSGGGVVEGGKRREVDALPSKPCPTGGQWPGGGGGGGEGCRRRENWSKYYPQNLAPQEVSGRWGRGGGGGGWRRETDLSITLRTLSCRKSVAGWGGWTRETDLCITLRTLSCRKSVAQNRSAGCVGWSVMDWRRWASHTHSNNTDMMSYTGLRAAWTLNTIIKITNALFYIKPEQVITGLLLFFLLHFDLKRTLFMYYFSKLSFFLCTISPKCTLFITISPNWST